jgi:membrane protein required for beta-lactamase induction
MKLIIIMISLWVERNIGKRQALRQLDWMTGYFRFMEQRLGSYGLWQGMWGVVLLLVPPLLVVALIYGLLWWLFFPLAYLFALAVLIFTLGPRQLEAQVKEFLVCREHGDDQASLYHAQAIIQDGHLSHGENLLPEVIKGILVQANSRYFAVFFWFSVLGPLGAVLARLLQMVVQWSAPRRSEGESFESGFYLAAVRLRDWMEWPVARIVALGFGVSGSFVDFWQTAKRLFMGDSRELLSQCGFAALQLKYHLDEEGGLVLDEPPTSSEEEAKVVLATRDMVRRALMFGLAILAVLTLYGLLI